MREKSSRGMGEGQDRSMTGDGGDETRNRRFGEESSVDSSGGRRRLQQQQQVEAFLQKSGEMEQLQDFLWSKLIESGFLDDMKDASIATVASQGITTSTVCDLAHRIHSVPRETDSQKLDRLEKQVKDRIRQSIENVRRNNQHGFSA